ncbi:A/G-specific adenine glycosylase [Sphingomonas sp. NSE70-1]|uniref:Adenine DNA glycosylase n=1 Tax=Sphingomonas caseinilyticus TaxID=2908205 RepID=A0ABT0RWL3_9SPHN|nr:A/G-specific adenine glycosylase [Sphingomonas caseinilyticus]MCL6699218.1 A/G-specific adenine glycosylase [Sphingomonas caseinilyticus]
MPASAATQLIDKLQPATRLLAHYDANARALPWRRPPGSPPPDPYVVWLSEVMLQQTTVATVKPRFRRFIQRWPTIEGLAAAEDEAILSEWAGLGYYARARNLIACAREVVRRGGFPQTESELRSLPGLGEYTAAAIAAIAFGEQATVIDTNVARVIARYHGIDRPLVEARADIRVLAEGMTPPDRAGDYAQAMMDLGATICRPKQPDCPNCPLSSECQAWATGSPERFPAPKVKAARPHRHGLAWWIERDGAVWLVRRPAKGLLGGMAALPGPEWGEESPPQPAAATISHGFTHFTLDLHIVSKAEPLAEGWWQPIDRMNEAGLPTLYAKAVQAMLSRKEALAA